MQTKKFLIIDDHRLFMEGMRHLLGKLDNVQVDLAESVTVALHKLEAGIQYDLLLLDISIPELDGFTLLQSLTERDMVVPVVMISASFDIDDVRKSIQLGALGFIHKNSTGQDMLASIKAVLSGKTVIPPEFHDQLDIVQSRHGARPQLVPVANQCLGARQIAVLRLMADGLSNQQIATVLAITEATVKYHIGILFKELGVRSRTACIKQARLQSLLE